MKTSIVLGSCLEKPPVGSPLSRMDIQLLPLDAIVHWSRCSLTANFLAEFFASSFDSKREALQNELSTVLNELLENAVKFAFDKQEPAELMVANFGDVIQLQASNVSDARHAEDLARQMRRVLEGDVEDMFLQQIEQMAAEDDLSSRLGFIMIRKNYNARLGLRITEGPRENLFRVTVEVLLDVEEVASS